MFIPFNTPKYRVSKKSQDTRDEVGYTLRVQVTVHESVAGAFVLELMQSTILETDQ
jgi:hypothetical protein